MKIKKMFLFILIVLFTLVAIGCTSNDQEESSEKNENENGKSQKEEPVFLNVTTGSNTATVYAFASSIAKITADEFPEINLTVQTSGGGKENLARLEQGRADIGVVYGPDIESAINGIGEYEDMADKYQDLFGIVSWPYAAAQLIVREDSGIKTVEDLKGKTIAVGAPGSTGSTFVWPFVLPEFGVTEENSNWVYLSQSAAADGLADGSVDAITALSKPKVGAIETISLNRKIKMLDISDPQREQIIENGIGLVKAEQSPDLYEDNQVNNHPIPTIGMSGTFIVRKDVPEDVVYKITKALFENIDEFHQSHSAAADITLETALEDMPVPLHPGAEKYFKEKGIIQ